MERYRNGFIALIYIMLSCLCNFAHSKDFGVLGHTYDIKEQDILEYINEKLQKVDLDALNQEMRNKVKASVERPKSVEGITNAKEDRSHYYDPTFVLKESIYNHEGVMIYPIGTTINPLEKMPLSQMLIFIDGDDSLQVKYALSLQKAQQEINSNAKIILIKGAPLDLQRQHKTQVYFDQLGYLSSKLGISCVPAIVTQEGLKLKIREIAINAENSDQHNIMSKMTEKDKK